MTARCPSRVNAIDEAQPCGRGRRGGGRVGRDHGIAVHRGAGERRHVDRRRDVGGDDAPRGVGEADRLGPRNRPDRGVQPAARFVEGDRGGERAHNGNRRVGSGFSADLIFDACWTRCPSSGNHQLLHGQRDGPGGARQRDDDAPPDEACAGAAQHRRRADLLVTEHAKQLAESVEPLLQQRADRFVRAVAGRDAGSAGRDDHLDAAVGEVPLDRAVHLLRIVPDERAAGDDVTRGGQQVGNRAAAGVVLQRPRVADGDDEAPDGIWSAGLVLDDAHDEDCTGRGARAPCGLTRTTRAERQTACAPARNGRPAGLSASCR